MAIEQLEKKESDATSVHVVPSHWLHVTFIFKLSGSPFSTLANTLAKNCGILNPNPPPSLPPGRTLHSMRQLLIGSMQIIFLKLAGTIFGLD